MKNDIAVVIAYRRSDSRPDDVLKLCAKAWLQQKKEPGAVIIADGSAEPVDFSELNSPKIIHIHVPFDGDFNLSFLRNVGARKAVDGGARFIQIMDNDIFPASRDYFNHCLRMMVGHDVVMPYVANSPESISSFDSVEDKVYQDFVGLDLDKALKKRFSYSTIFSKSLVFNKLGGFCQKFSGWGCEDDDFWIRARRIGARYTKLPQPILVHSYHEEDTANRAKKESDQYKKNFARLKMTQAGTLPNVRNGKNWGLVDLDGNLIR